MGMVIKITGSWQPESLQKVLFLPLFEEQKGKKKLDVDVTCVCYGLLIGNFREKGQRVQFLKHSNKVPEGGNADSNAIFDDIGKSAFQMAEFLIYNLNKVGL